MMQNRYPHKHNAYVPENVAPDALEDLSSGTLPLIVDIALDNNGKQLYQVHESSKLVRKQMPRSTNFTSNDAIHRALQPPLAESREETTEHDDDEKSSLISNDPKDIWSPDVEQAFEEALQIIPRNGANKIKVSGRSCGRNELISDYIFNKTGKFRTRKQVSSHIQVIKNLGQKPHIIKLINHGPSFDSTESQQQAIENFESIFSVISLNKSLGVSDPEALNVSKKRSSSSLSDLTYKRSRNSSFSETRSINIQNFSMAINGMNDTTPIYLSMQDNSRGIPSLRLNENADISSRFPGLDDFQNSRQIPILHNLVRLIFPTIPTSGFQSSFSLNHESNGIGSSSGPYSLFTCIYSYGKKVITLNEAGITLNNEIPFLVKFWKFFFNKFNGKDEKECQTAIKGIAVKQILYEDDGSLAESANMVAKLKIKLVLLWEFVRVLSFQEAKTTTTKLILPPKVEASTSITPSDVAQISVKHEDAPFNFENDSIVANYQAQQSIPQSTLQSVVASPVLMERNEPQLHIQRKFQSLQRQSLEQAALQQFPTYPVSGNVSQGAPLHLEGMDIKIGVPQSIEPNPQIVGYGPQPTPSANVDLSVIPTEPQYYPVEEPYPVDFEDINKSDFCKIYKNNFHDMF